MFEKLTEKLQSLFLKLSRQRKMTEENLSFAVREVRLALLEADVNYRVASTFVQRVKEKALGDTVLKAITPYQQFIKIIHDELAQLMGGEETHLNLKGMPSVVMLCGLQGAGKTTHCVKLANYLKKKKKKKILLVACDRQRPAAVEQLQKLGEESETDVFSIEGEKKAQIIAKKAYEKATKEAYDILLVDTAGRLHIDDLLMEELSLLEKLLNPSEILFVANACMGQDAVRAAAEFDKKISITGTILTMLDSDARAGAAISIREVTQKPLKFEGVGEKIEDLQVFNPQSMADRILGRGDIINLVKKAETHVNEEETKRLEKKWKKASFTYDDYLKQMGMIKKMGSLKGLMKMIPGFSNFSKLDVSDKQFGHIEAMILSMTKNEREERVELVHSRRKRIANGSGISLDEVNRMVKGFKRMKQFIKKMPKKGLMNMMPDNMKQMMGGNNLWH